MTLLYSLLVVLLAVFTVAPLEYPGAFESHTGLLAVYNLINLDQNPAQFLSWSPTIGRTFDIFRGEGAFPYWVAEIVHIAGLSYLDSIKLVYALAWIASGLAMFALARKYLSDEGALVAAAVYVYLPFHIVTVYIRGAFAESVAWAMFPLALLAVTDAHVSELRAQIVSLLAFAILFLIQPGMAILFGLVVLVLVVVSPRRSWHALRAPLTVIIGGLGTGALVYLPAMVRNGFNGARLGFTADYVQPYQLFSSQWGFGAGPGTFDTHGILLNQLPLQLGVVPVGLAIVALGLGWNRRNQPSSTRAQQIVSMSILPAVVLALFTFEFAAPLWSLLGVLVSYPWQIIGLIGLALALTAGAVVDLDARLRQPAMVAVLAALPVVASYGYLTPRYNDSNPTRPQIAIFGNNEIALLDYRIVGPLRHGATVRIQMKWQALRQVDHDYTVFVHAVNEDGNSYAQEDSKPQDGALPTIKWTPGQVISDTHTIQIDVDGPREGYHLEVGLYQAANGQRAYTETGADQLTLPRPGDPEPTISDQIPVSSTKQ